MRVASNNRNPLIWEWKHWKMKCLPISLLQTWSLWDINTVTERKQKIQGMWLTNMELNCGIPCHFFAPCWKNNSYCFKIPHSLRHTDTCKWSDWLLCNCYCLGYFLVFRHKLSVQNITAAINRHKPFFVLLRTCLASSRSHKARCLWWPQWLSRSPYPFSRNISSYWVSFASWNQVWSSSKMVYKQTG